ncbi:hypothetical protein MJH12_11730 [bacterium]|nr:hypothetical protein [bacterium]
MTNRQVNHFNSQIKLYQEYREKDQRTEALNVLEDLQGSYPESKALTTWFSDYYLSESDLLFKQRRFREAVNYSEKAWNISPRDGEANILVQAYMGNKQYFDAIQFVLSHREKLSKISQKHLNYQLAQAYSHMEQYSSAIYVMDNLVFLYPKDLNYATQLAVLYAKNEDFETSVEILDRIKESRPLSAYEQKLYKQAETSISMRGSYDQAYSSSFDIVVENKFYIDQVDKIISILDEAYIEQGSILSHYPNLRTKVSILSANDFSEMSGLGHAVIGLKSTMSNEILIRLGKVNNFKNLKGLTNTLWHEYNHHLLLQICSTGQLPPQWFIEGLASYIEPHPDDKKFERVLKKLHRNGQIFSSKHMPLSINSYPRYIMARDMVRYLDDEGYLTTILENLEELNPHYSFEQLFEYTYGASSKDFIDLWSENLQEKYANSNEH